MVRHLRLSFAVAALAALPADAQQPQTRTANDGNVVLDGIPEVPTRIAEQLHRYQNVRSASLADWSSDGNSIYILTRFGQLTQLHRVDMPGGARNQLTFLTEPVAGGVTRRPGSSDLLFSMDEGGAEFFQLFVLEPQSGQHRRLTDGRSRNTGARWSRDGQRVAFTSTKRDGRSNDVYVMDVADTSSVRLALEAPDGSAWSVADWHPDGGQLLIVNFISVTDSRVYLLDLDTGERHLLAGGEDRPASFASFSGSAPAFAHSGDGIFVSTDALAEFRQLAYLDLASGALEILTQEIRWDVETFAFSDDGSRAAFTVNEGGVSRLYLMDVDSRDHRLIESVPVGVLSRPSFSPDASQLAFSVTSAQSPSDVYTLDLGQAPLQTGRLTRWTMSEVGGLDTETFVAPELITYPTFDEVDGEPRQTPAFVYKPEGAGPHPVIVSIHGGPESQYRPRFSSTYQLWLNELGAAVIAPNVRGSAGYGKEYVKLDNGYLRENSVKDIGALLDWIATQDDLDASRVAVYGGSYGGYMVLASSVHYSDRLRAVVDIVGISNFVTFLENTQDYRRDLRRPEYGDEHDPDMRAFLESISPNRHADKMTAPLFVAQGQNDPRVPVTESEQVVRDVRANGRDVWYMNALNEGHGFRKKENRDLFSQITMLFFQTYLLGPRPISMGRSGN